MGSAQLGEAAGGAWRLEDDRKSGSEKKSGSLKVKKSGRIQLMATIFAMDSNREANNLWAQMRREKAAGGYPWTHLEHQEQEEVWIDPLSLPQDISRETLKRRDGTIPSEWFHLPEGAIPPTVEDLLREDTPEEEEEEEVEVVMSDKAADQSSLHSGRKTPHGSHGRRTPVCGRHRHRHKSSGGSSPAPSQRSEPTKHRQSCNLEIPTQSRSEPAKQPDHQSCNQVATLRDDGGGYEPVGQALLPGELPEPRSSRSPRSQLPSPPSGDETDSTQGCFSLLKTRTRSKEKRKKSDSKGAIGDKERRSSLESGCSEHNYESPKLLQRSPKQNPPQVDRNVKPTPKSDQEDGYEPVGRAPFNMETWIAEKNKEFSAILVSDADTRNINKKSVDKTNEVPKIEVDGLVQKHPEAEEVEVNSLQRNFSQKSIKSDSSTKSKDSKESKKLKKEKDKILKEQQKQEKAAKEKADREEKNRLKEEKKMIEKLKSDKQKEEKRLKEEQQQRTKDEIENDNIQKLQEDENERKVDEEKKINLEEEKQLKLKNESDAKEVLQQEKLLIAFLVVKLPLHHSHF